MCVCRVFQCCCGCTDLKTGVLIWAIIDAVFQIIFVIGTVASLGPTFNYWGIIVGLADIGLAIGAHSSNTGLMLAWLVVMMIQIVVIMILMVVVPIMVWFLRKCRCQLPKLSFWHFAGFCSWHGIWNRSWCFHRWGCGCFSRSDCRITLDDHDNNRVHFCFHFECRLHLLLDCGQFFAQKCHWRTTHGLTHSIS